MKVIKICNKIIEYSFYALFFFVPLVFTSDTSELFELNKMWLTFILALTVAASWVTKMIITKRFFIQRTPFDIPILLFLFSQFIATIHSLDTHISIWGYYSRFNGGFLSLFTYVFLYYAFVSNCIGNTLFSNGQKNQHSNSQTKTPQTNIALYISGIVVFILGFFISTIPSTSDYGVRITLLLLTFITSFFLFVKALPSTSIVFKSFSISLTTGFLVVLWALPSHFGADPTCLLFRGTFDVSCWTEAFQPKIRIFSTLGQPDWLAAYLAILLPISIVMFLQYSSRLVHPGKMNHESRIKNYGMGKTMLLASCFLLLTTLFYVSLTWTDSRSGFVAFWAEFIILAALILFKNGLKQSKILGILVLTFLVVSFFIRTPLRQLDFFSLENIKNHLSAPSPKSVAQTQVSQKPPAPGELGGTDSSKIRGIVWQGAIDAWKHNILFGTGVETFAFAYYLYRPAAHNLTSEWDYLYNKAHNEYLNYLTTTGIFGLGTYVLLNVWFLFYFLKEVKSQSASWRTKLDKEKLLTLNSNFELYTLNFALGASYIGIMITNFFNFSVVIVNLYLFLIPAFFGILAGFIKQPETFQESRPNYAISPLQMVGSLIVVGITLYYIGTLIAFWQADKSYALGNNLDHVNEYQKAYQNLKDAVNLRGDEPVFKDELSVNEGVLAAAILSQKQATAAASQLAQDAIQTSNDVVASYPNNIIFWKSRVRLFYALSQVDPKFFPPAVEAIEKAHALAPSDAKVAYNLSVLYGQAGQSEKAAKILEQTVQLKPDYRDAYFALALMYHDLATGDQTNKQGVESNKVLGSSVKNQAYQQKAVDTLHYILQNIAPTDTQAKETLKSWGEK